MWQVPITDRTSADVSYAISLNNRVRQAQTFDILSDEEKTAWLNGLKGCLNAVDLNRIEGNTSYIKDLLFQYGYSTIIYPRDTEWQISDFPFPQELERIRNNVQILVNGYYVQKTAVPTSLSKPSFTNINDIEKVLLELNEMINIMIANFNRICGTFVSGQHTILP